MTIWQWNDHISAIAGALAVDDLTLVLTMLFVAAGAAAVVLSWRARAPRESAHGEYHALLLASIAGMAVLVAAQNLITLFIGIELLSIPLYVLCATEMHRASSLESGLKYLIIGSVGSATLLYGLALLYGATGATDFSAIAASIAAGHGSDALLLTGIALVVVGLCFKASVAPFHQWTPDVYEGAPTPITAFMAVATKAAAFGVLLRIFDVALVSDQFDWGPALATLATITIIVGNVGALGQSSLKRMLAYSSVAQAGYIMAGVDRLHAARRRGDGLLPDRLPADEHRGVRGGHRARARDALRRRHRRRRRARQRATRAGLAADDRDALARRHPGDRRLHRQALPDPGARRRRLRLARRGHRRRLDDLARLLPAGDRRDLDARRADVVGVADAGDGRRLAGGRRRRRAATGRSRPWRWSSARRRSSSGSCRSRCSTSRTAPRAR